eukprot:TRINITY_DN298_c0_g1_i12.p1 TRINITY_DN298_c0_g1~~TRINITY_DN298_c0_g1_i12.p1  ORF type:complete len:1240 (+),score=272.67 TRINITY_DN298_c0_g1_i12:519-4238(+)
MPMWRCLSSLLMVVVVVSGGKVGLLGPMDRIVKTMLRLWTNQRPKCSAADDVAKREWKMIKSRLRLMLAMMKGRSTRVQKLDAFLSSVKEGLEALASVLSIGVALIPVAAAIATVPVSGGATLLALVPLLPGVAAATFGGCATLLGCVPGGVSALIGAYSLWRRTKTSLSSSLEIKELLAKLEEKLLKPDNGKTDAEGPKKRLKKRVEVDDVRFALAVLWSVLINCRLATRLHDDQEVCERTGELLRCMYNGVEKKSVRADAFALHETLRKSFQWAVLKDAGEGNDRAAVSRRYAQNGWKKEETMRTSLDNYEEEWRPMVEGWLRRDGEEVRLRDDRAIGRGMWNSWFKGDADVQRWCKSFSCCISRKDQESVREESASDHRRDLMEWTMASSSPLRFSSWGVRGWKRLFELVSFDAKTTFIFSRAFVGREEVLENLCTILSDSKRGRVMLTGDPGVGKTAIAVEMASRWAREASGVPGVRLAMAYSCSAGSSSQSAAEDFVDCLERCVRDHLSEYSESSPCPSSEQPIKGLASSLRPWEDVKDCVVSSDVGDRVDNLAEQVRAAKKTAGIAPLLIVVDALDEAIVDPTDSHDSVPCLLDRFLKGTPRELVRVLATSQPTTSLEEQLWTPLTIDYKGSRNDVELLLRESAQIIRSRHDGRAGAQDIAHIHADAFEEWLLSNGGASEVVKCVGGHFVMASTMLREICIAIEKDEALPPASEFTASSLDEYYRKLLQRSRARIGESQSAFSETLLGQLLAIMLAADWPLPCDIARGILLRPYDEKFSEENEHKFAESRLEVLSQSVPMICVNHGRYCFAHGSMRDWLLSRAHDFHVPLNQAHRLVGFYGLLSEGAERVLKSSLNLSDPYDVAPSLRRMLGAGYAVDIDVLNALQHVALGRDHAISSKYFRSKDTAAKVKERLTHVLKPVNSLFIPGEDCIDALLEVFNGKVCEAAVFTGSGFRNVPLLHLSVRYPRTLRRLIKAGADVNAVDQDGWTALIRSVTGGAVEGMKVLVELGADIDAKDKSGWTSLWLGAMIGNTDAVKYLLDCKAEAGIAGTDGMTPLHVATKEGHAQVVEVLRSPEDAAASSACTPSRSVAASPTMMDAGASSSCSGSGDATGVRGSRGENGAEWKPSGAREDNGPSSSTTDSAGAKTRAKLVFGKRQKVLCIDLKCDDLYVWLCECARQRFEELGSDAAFEVKYRDGDGEEYDVDCDQDVREAVGLAAGRVVPFYLSTKCDA